MPWLRRKGGRPAWSNDWVDKKEQQPSSHHASVTNSAGANKKKKKKKMRKTDTAGAPRQLSQSHELGRAGIGPSQVPVNLPEQAGRRRHFAWTRQGPEITRKVTHVNRPSRRNEQRLLEASTLGVQRGGAEGGRVGGIPCLDEEIAPHSPRSMLGTAPPYTTVGKVEEGSVWRHFYSGQPAGEKSGRSALQVPFQPT